MSICGGPKELPLEGPSGEDNCLDTLWGYCGPNSTFKMTGRRGQAGLKWRPTFEAESGTQGVNPVFSNGSGGSHGSGASRVGGDIELCSLLTCSVPLGSTQTEHRSFNTLKHALIKNPHSASLLQQSICLINSSIHHYCTQRTHSQSGKY